MFDIIAQYPEYTMAVFSMAITAAAWIGRRIAARAPEWANAVLIQAGVIVRSVVAKVAQRWVDSLKASRADGKLTEQEIKDAFGEAWDELAELLQWRNLSRVFGGRAQAEQWVKTEIEAAVNARKLDPTKRSRSTK